VAGAAVLATCVIRSSETSINFQRTTQHYIPEDRTVYLATAFVFNIMSLKKKKGNSFFAHAHNSTLLKLKVTQK
jgi:hypothetical protein